MANCTSTADPNEAVALAAEFKGHSHFDLGLADRAFRGIADTKDISKFLEECPLYDSTKKRWRRVPVNPKTEGELYGPLCEIFTSVTERFGPASTTCVVPYPPSVIPATKGDGPQPLKSRDIPVLKSTPDICFEARVKDKSVPSNFEVLDESGADSSGYGILVSPFEVTLQRNFGARANYTQAGVYARQVFWQQGNRHLVNCFVVSNIYIRLYAFGRDAVYCSSAVNIHKFPVLFVKFILGASSDQARHVGFDPSIFWKNGVRYIKILDNESNKPSIYRLVKSMPIFDDSAIRGRGTCVWLAQKGEEQFIIKDAWRPVYSAAEWRFMKDVEGLDGVGQMLSFQDNVAKISTVRGLDVENLPLDLKEVFTDRVLSRLLLVRYSGSIKRFKSRSHLLYAFRDAICGHRSLWIEKGILHRDISANNILLGQDLSDIGNRGVLIDFDMATRFVDPKICSLSMTSFELGTRAFQSVNVLQSFSPFLNRCKRRDYMDDLESFFYVLCWICCRYSGPGQKLEVLPEAFMHWDDDDPEVASKAKVGALSEDFCTLYPATPYFGEAFGTLMNQLSAFFSIAYVNRYYGPENAVKSFEKTEASLAAFAYDTILNYIDQAIVTVEAEDFEVMSEDLARITL